jgi:co-chaperonin GroES (HSP10)
MDEMTKGVIDLTVGYEDIEPLNDYVLVSVTTKDTTGKTASGLLYVKDQEVTAMPCLQVMKVSKSLVESGYKNVQPGDVIEIADVTRLTHFYGANMEKYSLVDKKYIAGVYRKKIGGEVIC